MIRNERGSLIMAFVIGFAILMMAVALGGFMQSYIIPLRVAKAKATFFSEVATISSLIKSCLPRKTGKCAGAGNWDMMVDVDVANPPIVVISKTDIDAIVASLDPSLSLAKLQNYTITMNREPNDADLRMGLITVNADISITPADPMLATFKESRTYRLQVLSPASFSLYIRSGGGSQITLATGSKLSVYGDSFFEVSGKNFNIANITSALGDLYIQNLNTNAERLNASSIADLDPFAKQVFSVKLNQLADIEDINSGVPPATWNQLVDYSYLYNTTNKFPLPIGPGPGVYSHGPQLPGDVANAAKAADTTYPSASNLGANSLEETCERAEDYMGFMRPLVLMRNSDSLTFDFTVGNAAYFCGLISADAITIKTSPGGTHIVYGHLNVKKLTITGGGHVLIVDPKGMRQSISSVPMPTDFSPAEASRQLLTLSATTANNFFVPFFQKSAAGNQVMKAKLTRVSDYFEDCGTAAGLTYLCWIPFKDPIDYERILFDAKIISPGFKFVDFGLSVSEGL